MVARGASGLQWPERETSAGGSSLCCNVLWKQTPKRLATVTCLIDSHAAPPAPASQESSRLSRHDAPRPAGPSGRRPRLHQKGGQSSLGGPARHHQDQGRAAAPLLRPRRAVRLPAMEGCFLEGHGPCGGKLSAEHYFSAALLRELAAERSSIEVAGLPWQPIGEMQTIGIGSLKARVLCQKHNSDLQSLDTTGGKLFRFLRAVASNPTGGQPSIRVDGLLLERWLLKILCGLVAQDSSGRSMPADWPAMLVGRAWQARWGLYMPSPSGKHSFANHFGVHTHWWDGTQNIAVAEFRIGGVFFTLVLAHVQPNEWGTYRPGAVLFKRPTRVQTLELDWPQHNPDYLVYVKHGDTTATQP